MKVFRAITMGLLAVAAIGLFLRFRSVSNEEQKALEETRRDLRAQGFKMDLAEFDFSTDPEMWAREAALTNAAWPNLPGRPEESRRRSLRQQLLPQLMQAVGRDTAVLIWRYPLWPSDEQEYLRVVNLIGNDLWAALRESFDADRAALDAACRAALSGPVRFNLNAKDGYGMLLPHLTSLKNLARTLGGRAVVELHDGNRDAAWTNALATTRLITGWVPEPTEVSTLVWYACVNIAFDTMWQVLSAGGWGEERLVALQREWESVDFLGGLPETAAFARASTVAICQQERLRPRPGWAPFSVKEVFRSPRQAWFALGDYRRQLRYRHHGSYEDERGLLLHYRDRELEFRQALEAPTWIEMQPLHGVTNITQFKSRYRSGVVTLMNARQVSLAMAMYHVSGQVRTLPGRAADAEARRRLIVAAIALERHRERQGSYPETLSQLAPGLLKEPPMDFMDGQPLRYLLSDGGRYVLYSVGLDGVDHGGEMARPGREGVRSEEPRGFAGGPGTDLVWPRPASWGMQSGS